VWSLFADLSLGFGLYFVYCVIVGGGVRIVRRLGGGGGRDGGAEVLRGVWGVSLGVFYWVGVVRDTRVRRGGCASITRGGVMGGG